jgi:hypothetical protein
MKNNLKKPDKDFFRLRHLATKTGEVENHTQLAQIKPKMNHSIWDSKVKLSWKYLTNLQTPNHFVTNTFAHHVILFQISNFNSIESLW